MKCFKVYTNQIESRIDPLYYAKDLFSFIEFLPYQILEIEKVVEYLKTGFAAGSKIQDEIEKGIIQIRPTNIGEDRLLKFDKNIYVKMDYPNQADYISKKEILFNNTNSQELVGKSAYFNIKGNYVCSNHITRIKVKEEIILPQYLWIILNIYQKEKMFYVLCTNWNNQSGINIELLKKLKIPVPPLETQNKIVEIMDNAYSVIKEKEKEAKNLIDSIEEYILSELNIEIPKIKNSLTYVSNLAELKNNRIDTYYYLPKFEEIKKSIYGGKYEVVNLEDSFENDMIKGILPKENEKDGDLKVLKIKNILNNGLIDISDFATAKNIFKEDHKIHKGEIIIVITGATIGKVGLWTSNENIYLGGDMVKFKTNEKYNPYYVQTFLLTQLGQYEIKREITGATNGHLSISNLRLINIPRPPITIQDTISYEVKKRIQKTYQLNKEAKNILDEAKKEVELIIFTRLI